MTTQQPHKADLSRCLDDVAELVATALVDVRAGRACYASLRQALTRCAARIALLKLDIYPELVHLASEPDAEPPAE